MSAPDIHAIAARKVHGLPDNWQPRIYGCLDRDLGFYLRGAVPIGTYSRRVVITADEVRRTRVWWENETGLCSYCGGSGQQVQSVGIDGTTYRDCAACKTTGKALHVRRMLEVQA